MKRREQAIILLEKARQDETLVDKVMTSDDISDEIIGFHCQQAVEKLLKATLGVRGVRYHRTHNLRLLMDLLADEGYPVPQDLQDLDAPTPFAAIHRYQTPPVAVSLSRGRVREKLRRLREWAEPQIRG